MRLIALGFGLAILLAVTLFILADRGRTLRITATTNHLVLEIETPDNFTFQTDAAFISDGQGGVMALSGALVLGGATRLTLIRDPDDGSLRMIFEPFNDAPPVRIGDVVVAGNQVNISAEEARNIAVMLATGGLKLGGQARSNGTAYLENAEYVFVERTPGVGDVVTLAGRRGRFDRLGFADVSGSILTMDVLIDLSGPSLSVWAEGIGEAPTLTVTRPLSRSPVTIAPSVLDRLLANPIGNLVPGLLTLILVLGQVISLVPKGTRDNREHREPAP